MAVSTTAAARRTKYGLTTAVLAIAITAVVVLVNVLAARFAWRVDVTATGEHRLSPRTAGVLSRLPGPCAIVVAGDLSKLDRLSKQDVFDVLEQFARASKQLEVTTIDTSSSGGIEAYTSLIRQLAERDAAAGAEQSKVVTAAAERVKALAAWMDSRLAPALQSLGEAVVKADASATVLAGQFDQRAAAARVAARELERVRVEALAKLDVKIAGVAVPATSEAGAALKEALSPRITELTALAGAIRQFQASAPSAKAEDVARALAGEIVSERDQAARAADAAGRLRRLDTQRVAEALRSETAVLLVGPPETGLAAIEPRDLFPVTLADGVRADNRRRAEQLLGSGLAGLIDPARPIVVFVHAEAQSILGEVPLVRKLAQRLATRGVDIVEWPIMLVEQQPSLVPIDPSGKRPVVYIALSPDSSQGSGKQGEASGVDRATRLGREMARLLDAGAAVVLSLNPSIVPTYGNKDPLAEPFASWGLEVDSGLPILQDRQGPGGREVFTDHVIRVETPAHAIAAAIRGLPTFVAWPVAVRSAAALPQGVTVSPLLSIAVQGADGAAWQESQWLRYWQVPRAQRGSVPDPPKFDEGKDSRQGPWTVAAAIERVSPAGGRQRAVVVGTNNWFIDAVAQQSVSQVDGRSGLRFPGNIEMFDAVLAWASGQEGLIASSPESRAIPVVSPMSPTLLAWLRGLFVAGVPIVVLVLGAAWRWWRG
jgi:hypothetical protein